MPIYVYMQVPGLANKEKGGTNFVLFTLSNFTLHYHDHEGTPDALALGACHFALSKRDATSSQFTTFHQAEI